MARQPRTKKPAAPKAVAEKPAENVGDDVISGTELTPAQVEALDRDDDGHAGGSRRKLGEHELAALCSEAYEAYDFQGERIRFDTTGRRWTFRPEKVGAGYSVLSLAVERLDVRHEDTISTALLASEMGRDMVADVVGKLAERLA